MDMDTKPIEPSQGISDDTQRRSRLVLWTVVISAILLLLAAFNGVILRLLVGAPISLPSDTSRPSPLVMVIVIDIFFCALIVLVRLGRPTISALLLIGAWTLLTTLASLISGVTSFVPALLILPICAAGLLLDGIASLSLAGLATLLIGALAWLEFYGLGLPQRPEPTFLIQYRPFIAFGHWVSLFWGAAGLTWLLAGGLQQALKQSRSQAQELQELSTELEARVTTQTAELLAQSQEAARYEERTRLARDIHDTLAQGLTGIVVQLGAAQRALAFEPSEAEEHLTLAQRMAREALAEARQSVWNLRSPKLEQIDLQDALQRLLLRPLGSSLQATFEQHGSPWPLSPAVEGALLRVVQEGLTNVTKHAGAEKVMVQLCYQPDTLTLTIHDDGQGFAQEALHQHETPPTPWSGWGLLGMRERIAALGGSLALVNDDGARIIVTISRQQAEGIVGVGSSYTPADRPSEWTTH